MVTFIRRGSRVRVDLESEKWHLAESISSKKRYIWTVFLAFVSVIIGLVVQTILLDNYESSRPISFSKEKIHTPSRIIKHTKIFLQKRARLLPSGVQNDHCSLAESFTSIFYCLGSYHQYTTVLDAGSTGSRIHVYRFLICKCSGLTLENEVVKSIKPGLQSYSNPELASKSLIPLLDFAKRNIPKRHWDCSPISFYATAGLRMTGEPIAQAILGNVKTLSEKYPFPIETIEIMDGKDEGVYAWIALNYLLDTIEGIETVAIMDLGGGSTQLVFEPVGDPKSFTLVPNDHIYSFNYGTRDITLYQHSWDGYGLISAREIVPNCENGYDDCKISFKDTMFSPDSQLETIPQILRNLGHPPLTDFKLDIYAFSFFWDIFSVPFGYTNKTITVGTIGDVALKCCDEGLSPAPELNPYNDNFCRDLTYIYTLLRFGYNLPDRREIITSKKVKKVETGWYLGAALSVIESKQLGHQCLYRQPTPLE